MSAIAVAGVVSVRMACRVASFPVPFVPSQRNQGGLSVRLASVGWNVARTLQCLGTEVAFATYVGADPVGQLVSQGLRERGLYGPATLVCPTQPVNLSLYDDEGRRAGMRDHRFGPELRYPAEIFASLLDGGAPVDLAVLTSVGFTRSLIPVAIGRGIRIATDLQLVEDIDGSPYQDRMRTAHILACSHERLAMTPRDWVTGLWRRFGTEVVLVGCGAAGAVLGIRSIPGIWRIDPITPRGVVQTDGAGDTLLASFAHHYVTLDDPVAAARHAVLTAGWKVGGSAEEEPGLASGALAALRAEHGLPAAHRIR